MRCNKNSLVLKSFDFSKLFWFLTYFLYTTWNYFLLENMNILKEKLSHILTQAIKQLYDVDLEDLKIDTPPKKELGDFCFWPFLLAKPLGKSPAQISNELKDYFLSSAFSQKELFQELSIAGPYLNFKLSSQFYNEMIGSLEINTHPQNGKTIVVDYIGANMGKPLHIGHMCTPNQWQITCNLYRYFWYEVIGDSHFGDWGIIFGKLILAYKLWWDQQRLATNALEHLYDLYVKITQEIELHPELEEDTRKAFKKLSHWDKDSIEMWKTFTSASIKSAQTGLDILWVKPTYNIGESFYEWLDLPKLENYPDLRYSMKDIVQELLEKNIASKNDDGSVGVVFDEAKKIPSVMLQKRDGTHGYLASDLAAIKYRVLNWNPEKIIYHIDNRQELHFKQAFEIASEALWTQKEKLIFAGNGFISLKTGAMSSRTGNIIRLEALLDEGVKRAKDILQEKSPDLSDQEKHDIALLLGVWSIKYNYLSKSRLTDVIFDWDDALSFEGNSFPYVAYSYVRAKTLLRKSWVSKEDLAWFHDVFFDWDEQLYLVKELFAREEVLFWSLESNFYHTIVLYVYQLAKLFSHFYNNVSILWEKDETKKLSNLFLIEKYIKTLENIFDILAIKLPQKM